MLTCKNCRYKAKNPLALNAYECAVNPPAAQLMQTGMGQVQIMALRPPVSDETAACEKHTAALSVA